MGFVWKGIKTTWANLRRWVGGEGGHRWLSQAIREAERTRAGQVTAFARLRASARETSAHIRERSLEQWDIAIPFAIILALHIPFIFAPQVPGLPSLEDGREFLLSLWQVGAAVLGIAFVILILIVETIHRTAQGEFVWRRFVRSSRLFPITAFLLGTILAGGGGAFFLFRLPVDADPQPQGLLNLVLVDSLLYAATVLLVLQLYRQVFKFLNPAFIQKLVIESLTGSVRKDASKTVLRHLRDHLLRQACETIGLRYMPGTSDWPGMHPVRIGGQGYVVDINLRELRRLAELLPAAPDYKAVVATGVGQSVGRDQSVAVFVHAASFNDGVSSQVQRCFKIVSELPQEDREVEEAFSYLTEQALRSIEAGRLEQFHEVLVALREPIRVTLEEFRSYGIEFDAEAARSVFSFEWQPLERPFHAYERILEAAARSNDSDIVQEAAYWPYSVMKLAMDEGDHFFFRRAVQYYTWLYQLSRSAASERASELLGDRSWRHPKEFGSMILTFGFRGVMDVAELGRLQAYVDELHTTYTDVLKLAMDASDRRHLERAAAGFWPTFDIGFATANSQIAEYMLDLVELPSHLGELDRAKANTLRHISDVRGALWITLGGWVCHLWQTSQISAEFAAYSFGLIQQQFHDFRSLWRAFNSAFRYESGDRLPISRWLMREQPEGQVVSLRPESLIALFFTLVSLAIIPEEIAERLHTLATPRDASWARTQIDSSIAEVRANPSRWEQIGVDVSQVEKQDALKALAEGAEKEEKRREELHIMEQPLSAAKLAEFKTDFLDGWASAGLLRRLLQDAQAIEYSQEPPPGRRIQGIWRMVRKGAFVEETGSTFWMETGRGFGSGMANGEDNAIYKALSRRARRYRLGRQTVARKLSELIRRLRDDGFTADVILFAGQYTVLGRLEQADEYVPSYRLTDNPAPYLQGTFQGIPIYMHQSADTSEFLVVSLRRVGKAVQYLTENESIFRRFEIQGYMTAQAQEVAAGDRSWLPQEVRSLPDDAIIEYLRGHVSIRIEQSIEMRIDNSLAARRLAIPNLDAPSSDT